MSTPFTTEELKNVDELLTTPTQDPPVVQSQQGQPAVIVADLAEVLARGIPLIPLLPNTKEAFLSGWQNKASASLEQIAKWLKKDANYNFGCVAKLDGDWFFDADDSDVIAQIEEETGHQFPETFQVQGSKELPAGHYYFAQTERSRKMGNRKKAGVFDAQVHNKYVVCPGSIHPDGMRYKIVNPGEILQAPDWLIDWIEGHSEKEKEQKGHVVQAESILDPAFSIAQFLAHYGLTAKQNGRYYVTNICPVAGHKHQQSRKTGFIYDGNMFGFHCFATKCLGSSMSVGQVIKYLNFYQDAYPGVIWKSQPDAQPAQLEAAGTIDVIEPTPTLSLIPYEVPELTQDAIYGLCGDLAGQLKMAPGYSYPAVVTAFAGKGVQPYKTTRSNLFTCMVGPKGCGKTVAIQQAIELCDLDTLKVVTAVPASDRGVIESIKKRLPAASLLFSPDEFDNVLKKSKILNSTLAGTLCKIWGSDEAGSSTKDGEINAIARVSLIGGIPCSNPSEFPDYFSRETKGGLEDRFVYGFSNYQTDYEEPTFAIQYGCEPGVCAVVPENWERLKEWRKKGSNRGRLGENAMRIALITSAANGDATVTYEAMERALLFMEWQEKFRAVYKPGTAKNQNAECFHLMDKFFASALPGSIWKWRDLARQKHWYDYGTGVAQACRDQIIRDGIIEYEQKTGVIRVTCDVTPATK